MKRRDFIQWGVRAMVAVLAVDSYFFEPRWIEYNEFDFSASQDVSTPITLVHLSDLHLREIDEHLYKLADRVHQSRPDLICITGDSIDKHKYLPILDRYLGTLDQDIMKFAILGNWEYWGGIDLGELHSVYQRHNCQLLVNDSAFFPSKGKKILVTGVDDFIGGDPNIKVATKNYADNDFHLVLNHCPEYRDFMMDKACPRIDLVLSGHTHGGQVNLLGFIPVLPPGSGKYVKGWYREMRPAMYVSAGIGTSGLPFRLGCRPEMTVFRLMI